MITLDTALPLTSYSGSSYDGLKRAIRVRSATQQEQDVKVGAAGELFVFELLKASNSALPNFSTVNWPSTIRKHVTSHPDYHTMLPWHGKETADIIYNDIGGFLTNLLIDKGYLDGASWETARPNYLIEVKTTTGPCNHLFYMSKEQYEHLKVRCNDQDNVYVIFRVFNVDKESIGLKVYIDPAEMMDNGGLVFTAETWSVTPL